MKWKSSNKKPRKTLKELLAEWTTGVAQERLLLDVSEAILEAMDYAGVSVDELAERVGLSKYYVRQLLDGRSLSVRKVAQLLHALGYEMTVAIREHGR